MANLHEAEQEPSVIPANKEHIKKIWQTAGILALVTAVEFILAFTMPRGGLLISLFIILTIVKAFYIVAEFMHLRHEIKTLIYTIIVPTVFVIWLILALLLEGGNILDARV
jgi:cytochrome c oxidase subunit 4